MNSRLLSTCAALLLLSRVAAAQPKSLVIGIDGLGYGDFGFSAAATPNMDRLIDGSWATGYRGAYSDRAFAGGVLGLATQQPTVSGPGWSTFLTGVWLNRHHVPNNSFTNPDFENNPSYLETLEENVPGIHTATIINWAPIDTFIIATADDVNSSIDLRSTPGNDQNVANTAAAHIATLNSADPIAIFIHLDEIDGAGHSFGSGSPNYGAEVTDTDALVGQLLGAVTSRANFANEDWQVIVSADHGHRALGGHGGQSTIERTIPFIVSSKQLTPGTLAAFPQRVSHADVAPTVLDHFGVTAPAHYFGISRADGGFVGNVDINGDGSISGDGTGTFENDDVVAFIAFWLQPNTIAAPNPADLNSDGIADIADWALINAKLPALGAAILTALRGPTVPEPTTIALLLIACGGILTRRPGRSRFAHQKQ